MLLLAEIDAETQREIIKATAEVMSGTPDAARSEPFTWVMLFGIGVLLIAILGIVCTFCWFLIMKVITFIQSVNLQQQTIAAECHRAQRESLVIATDAAAKCESAMLSQVDSNDRNTEVMERVLLRLGAP